LSLADGDQEKALALATAIRDEAEAARKPSPRKPFGPLDAAVEKATKEAARTKDFAPLIRAKIRAAGTG